MFVPWPFHFTAGVRINMTFRIDWKLIVIVVKRFLILWGIYQPKQLFVRLYIELYIQNKGILNKWFPYVQSNRLIVNINKLHIQVQHRIFLKQTAQLLSYTVYTLLLSSVRAKIVQTDTR